ncbi:MAG: T9SS type A sorting domain-containing protein [candidate division WOR-3 bacterium]|nr:MAG: T9SS type A sorting domain-containing protein [candidate division WOR-3 bacterium]
MRFFNALAVLACCLVPPILHARVPDRAFIVVIDGLRNDEGFEAESTFLRHIWNDLRPLGTVNRRFWNRGWTATTAGHTTILSGVRQAIRNNGGADGTVRSFDPLLFEYYRRYTGAPESECGTFYGKWGNCASVTDFGLEPAFGEAYRGFRSCAETSTDDTANLRNMFEFMDSKHPKLVLVNLKNVDGTGHTGDYAAHLDAVRTADSVVYELYKKLQAVPPYTDTFYKDRTLLIVTTDHGRNDNAHGSFQGHGKWNHGCRDLIFYAFGPGIAAGKEVYVQRDRVDIAPTVGAMLGFPTPFAEGEVMTELFADGYAAVPPPLPGGTGGPAQNLSSNSGFSRDPDIGHDLAGNLHLVWSDNTPGKWSVFYRRSTDDGVTWSAARTMFDYQGKDSVMQFARVAAHDSVAIAATGYGRHAQRTDSLNPSIIDTTVLWYPWVATSANSGVSWTETSLFDSTMVSCAPAVTVRDGRYGLVWSRNGTHSWQPVRNGAVFNRRVPAGGWDSLPDRLIGGCPLHLAAADDGGEHHVAVSRIKGDEDSDIIYFRSSDGLTWQEMRVTDDASGLPAYDCDPEFAVDRLGAVHLFWSRKPDSGGAWQLMYGSLDSATAGWDTVRLTTSSLGARQPHAAIKGDTLCLAWIDYRDGSPEVYVRFSTNLGQTWVAPTRITWAGALTRHPRVAAAGSGFYLVWQELALGNWDVFGRRVDVYDRPMVHGWAEMSSMPLLPSGMPVRRGGWLELNPGSGIVYAQKGCKTNDFYSFSFDDFRGRWTTLARMPYQTHPRWASRPPRRGSKGCCDRYNTIYVTQGNNTLAFWSYHIAEDSWAILPDIPEGPSRRKVKAGADMVYVPDYHGDDYVYLLKGYRDEFYRFNVTGQVWEQLEDAPTGARNTWDRGSWLVGIFRPGAWSIYAHKAKYHELWRYDVSAQSWDQVQKAGMPFIGRLGRKKKSKDGGSACLYDGDIFALKGGDTQEFWRYGLAADSWTELDTMPEYGSTGRKKRVKHGADIVSYGHGFFFALKGNKTLEMWLYALTLGTGAGSAGSGVAAADSRALPAPGFELRPNPLVGRQATVHYSLPRPGPVLLEVFDIVGRSVSATRTPCLSVTGSLPIDLRGLSAGVYLVRLESDRLTDTRKLVIR